MERPLAAVLFVGLAACASPREVAEAPSAGAADPSSPVAPATPVYAVPGPPKGEAPAPPPHRPSPFWTDAEMALLDQGLEVLNATRADMGFQKRPIEDPFRLAVVNRALDDPLTVGEEAQAWDDRAREGRPESLLGGALASLGITTTSRVFPSPSSTAPEMRESLPGPAAAAAGGRPGKGDPNLDLLGLLMVVGPAGESLSAFPDAAADRRASLLRRALLSQVEKPGLDIQAADLKDEEFLARAARMELGEMASLARCLLSAAAFLDGTFGESDTGHVDRWTGRRRYETSAGPVVLYGYGDDVHDGKADEDAVLVIDLGGNDTWTRGASASVLKNRPVSIAIDLAGNDRYVGREDLSFGGALGGVAIQWDGAGDDFYDGGHCSLGAGICGVGVLVDEGGDDVYRAKDFCIGAGAFGIGILLDKGGNDLYHGDLFAEGFASTRGCGVLADLDGNDVYDAGGAHLHAPLYNDRYQSLSQGFSIGMRPDASGGVGVLVDVKGNDRYTADIYGQGASYWYALGILVDDDGNDTYNLGQYGQGSGIHLSAGILVDRAGSDLYYLKNGVGMGGAHDYSVGMLVDRGGDDYYAGSGGTQGGALTNSVALLFDMAGNDAYAAANEGVQGYASPARGTGGMGLLMDAGGKDVYTDRGRNGEAWTQELLGAGLDEPDAAVPAAGSGDPGATAMTQEKAKEAVDRDGTVPGPDGKPVDDLEKLWTISRQWEVGDNRVIVPLARERLWALGRPALEKALANVGTKDGLEFRAVETTVAKFPADEVVPRLLEKTKDPAAGVRRGAVSLLAGLKASSAVDRITEMLRDDADLRGAAMAALGALKVAPPEVAGFLRAPKEGQAVQAVLCLASVGDPAAVAAVCGALGPDHAFPVRLAAADRLAALGAVEALARVAGDETLPVMARRNAIRALGRTKSPAAAAFLAAALRSPDRGIRMSAFQAAGDLAKALGDAGKDLAAAAAAARDSEQDPLVKRMR